MAESTRNLDVSRAVESLQVYIKETEDWINALLENTKWTAENILEEEEKVQCSIDASHFVPLSKLDDHVYYCSKAKLGYSKKDLAKDQSSDFFYEKATTVVPIKLDPATISSIIASVGGIGEDQRPLPETVDCYLKDLSPAERLKIYDYCTETAKTAQRLQAVKEEELMLLSDKIQTGKKPTQKSRLELLAEARDQKRRRQSYKGKNVHTGKKSHTEILKEVINSQMDILRTMLSDEQAASEKNPDSPSTSSRSSSVQKQESFYERKKHRSSRSRSSERSRKNRSCSRERSRKNRSRSRERSRSRSRQKYSSSKRKRHRSRSRDRSHSRHKKKKHKYKHDKD